ncbi:hypothetical protein RBH94_06860 [Aestuariibaculum sp. YM273]|uniref:hypothetical protein n=1 Tax=Aestuariibaculum sp. YM273 TaxID=3070659 RepID=UPI0027DE8339|nr:hypothetical protein [Aestuariibaculum sp. YM273]WMI66872.1 hypothetical protein RBH94_06860 [Aestuariibaculum sp. YM273]
MTNGKILKEECKSCEKTKSYHINQIYANESKIISFIAIMVFVLGTGFALYMIAEMFIVLKTVTVISSVAFALLFPILIYTVLEKEDRLRVRIFNNSFVKED